MSKVSLMLETLSMDFPFTVQNGTDFVLHLKQAVASECLHVAECVLLRVLLTSQRFEVFPLGKEKFLELLVHLA